MEKARKKKICKEFGQRLQKLRKDRKMSTRDLAHHADMDPGNINEIETGKKNCTLTTIVTLAEALQVSPSELMGG